VDGKKKWLWLALAFGAGVVLAPKVRTLPLVSKLPSL
jgi:hypothetical protein